MSRPCRFEMSKHSTRTGRLSRLSDSRRLSSASIRRSRFCSAAVVSCVSASSAFSAASSARRFFSPRAGALTSTAAPRSSERKPARPSVSVRSEGTMSCGGTLGAAV